MSTKSTLIPVEEYLNTVYRPDCDYVDGEVLERNMGERPHSRLQTFFGRFFAIFESDWKFETLSEQRLHINPERYRIPDIMLAPLPDSDERIVYTPPLLCIEILSSRDRMREIQERIDDYAAIGVQMSWVVDPWRETAFDTRAGGKLQPAADLLTVPGTTISIAVSDIWRELDRLQKLSEAKP